MKEWQKKNIMGFMVFVDKFRQHLLRQLLLSRCNIPVTQLQTGPPVLLVQICSHPPLFSLHQSDSEGYFR